MAIVRKSIAVLLIALLLAIPIGSFFVEWRLFDGRSAVLAYSLFGLGALFCVINLYLSFLRPVVHRLRAQAQPLRHVSGVPLLGMTILPGLMLAPPSVTLSAACLALMAVDTGNLLWFVACVWKDGGFWTIGAAEPAVRPDPAARTIAADCREDAP